MANIFFPATVLIRAGSESHYDRLAGLNLNSPLLAARDEFKFKIKSFLRRKCGASAQGAEAKNPKYPVTCYGIGLLPFAY